jgi:hypothetical protein
MVQELKPPIKEYWVFHNITTFLASIVFAFALFQTDFFGMMLASLGAYGYIGSFFVGIFFVTSFTVIPATAVLILLAGNLNFMAVAIFAAVGASIGDFFIFRFVRDGLAKDLQRLFAGVGNGRIFHIFHSKFFGALTPVIGAFIIASPLPDEFGIGLLGISDMDNKIFVALSFILNVIGISILLGAIYVFS